MGPQGMQARLGKALALFRKESEAASLIPMAMAFGTCRYSLSRYHSMVPAFLRLHTGRAAQKARLVNDDSHKNSDADCNSGLGKQGKEVDAYRPDLPELPSQATPNEERHARLVVVARGS